MYIKLTIKDTGKRSFHLQSSSLHAEVFVFSLGKVILGAYQYKDAVLPV